MLQDLPDAAMVLGDAPAYRPGQTMIETGFGPGPPDQASADRTPRWRLAPRHPGARDGGRPCAKPAIAAGGFEPWAGDMARLARREPSAASCPGWPQRPAPAGGSTALRPYVAHLLRRFGPLTADVGQRLAGVEPRGSYRRWLGATLRDWLDALSPAEQDQIMGPNRGQVLWHKVTQRGRSPHPLLSCLAMKTKAAVAWKAGQPLTIEDRRPRRPARRRSAGRDQGHRHLPHRLLHALGRRPGRPLPGHPRP